jgi:hypothetical protein
MTTPTKYTIVEIPVVADCLSCSKFKENETGVGTGICGIKQMVVSRRIGTFCSDLDITDRGWPVGYASDRKDEEVR